MVVPVDRGYPGLGRPKTPTPPPRWPKAILWLLLACGALVGVGWLILVGMYDVHQVGSDNMSPTLEIGDRIYSRPAVSAGRGDIVIYYSVAVEGPAIGRVVAIEGDVVSTVNGTLTLNGILIRESYLTDGIDTTGVVETVVPTQHYFILGDNRSNSFDSRIFGPVSGDTLRSRVRFIGWPLGRFGGL